MNKNKYNITSLSAPPMPRSLPGFVRQTISKVPVYMRPAAANALFPPAVAQMRNVSFRYVDNVLHEPCCSMEGCVAVSGIGKGYIDPMIETIAASLREHDVESRRKLLEWQRECKSKGANKDKPERPNDAAILMPEPDMTNPALIQLLMDAEREDNASLYTQMAEIDLLDQCSGGHRKVTKVIRLNFDNKRYGAQRATVDGISGNPHLRWKFNFSCVEEKARAFFKDCLIDGTLGRIGISYIQKPSARKQGIPQQGDYDEAYQKRLEEYLVRLRSARGEITVPNLGNLIGRLSTALDEVADLSDDNIFESFAHRSLMIAWMKGCVLYVAEGYRWTPEIAAFVEWSLYYDLWSKVAVFVNQMKKSRNVESADVRKYGPANMLDMLPDSFCQAQLENLRSSLDKPVECAHQLDVWTYRKYITYDERTRTYRKTEGYLAKHPKELN